MNSSIRICPWLGTDEDRELRYLEPGPAHVCYSRKPAAPIPLEHQAGYCLVSAHIDCPYYLEHKQPILSSGPVLTQAVDEFGPALDRVSGMRLGILALVALLLVGATTLFGPSLLTRISPGMAQGQFTSTVALLPSEPYDDGMAAEAIPVPSIATTFEFIKPTGTPTPYPGGTIYSLYPDSGKVGWVANNEQHGNHLGDAYIYSGVFDNVVYLGLFQFDLSVIPRGASINAAILELSGDDDRRLGSAGAWQLSILDRTADDDWGQNNFDAISNAPQQFVLSPSLSTGDLLAGGKNIFQLPVEALQDMQTRLIDQHLTISFRLDGPRDGENSIFAWASGFAGTEKDARPRLLLSVGPAPLTPYPTHTGTPTATLAYTSTPTARSSAYATLQAQHAAATARMATRDTREGTDTVLSLTQTAWVSSFNLFTLTPVITSTLTTPTP